MSKVTGAYWFDTIGIVQVVQEHQWESYRQTGVADYKYYIGVGLGKSEYDDKHYIASYGKPFDAAAGDVLFSVDRPLKDSW